MLKIAVCDDVSTIVDKLEQYIREYFSNNNGTVQIFKFYDGETLLGSELQFNLVFLDVEMGGIDGITAAEYIRKNDMDLPIVYITGYSDYCMQAHHVHAFDFIKKPFEYNDIERVLNDFMRVGEKLRAKRIELQTAKSNFLQDTDEILYFVKSNTREITMYTLNGSVVVKGNLSNIYAQLDQHEFYMTHSAYIVNLKHVKTVQNYYDIYMVNGDLVPLSQKRREEFKQKMHKFVHR